MSKMSNEVVSYHRAVMTAHLDAVKEFGSTVTKEQVYGMAKEIYEVEYKGKIPLEEIEIYNPNHQDDQ